MKKNDSPVVSREEALNAIEHNRSIAFACDNVTDSVRALLTFLVRDDGGLEISEEFINNFVKFLESIQAIHEDAYSRHLALLPIFTPWGPEYVDERDE